MKSRLQTPQKTSSDLIDPNEVINTMIDLRIQMAELELQAKLLQPAFFAACLALNTETINLERAAISRKLTPGLWDYSLDIIDQNNLLKELKLLFRQTHEPVGGREVTWAIKLLLPTA